MSCARIVPKICPLCGIGTSQNLTLSFFSCALPKVFKRLALKTGFQQISFANFDGKFFLPFHKFLTSLELFIGAVG